MLLSFCCLFSYSLVINQLKVAARKLSEEEKGYLDNGFPADLLNNIFEELNSKVNAK